MRKVVNLLIMKNWRYGVYAGVAILIGYALWVHREDLGLAGSHGIGSSPVDVDTTTDRPNVRPARINWQKVNRSQDGFQVEMPVDVKQTPISVFNESGETEQANMIYSNPDGVTSFAVTWQDNPPVARVNNREASRTLEMARDGTLQRTQTTLINEKQSTYRGFPARDIVARNSGGGILDCRLILAGNRLYMLTAVFPSMAARREEDVNRFYRSLVPGPATSSSANSIPQTLPPAGN